MATLVAFHEVGIGGARGGFGALGLWIILPPLFGG